MFKILSLSSVLDLFLTNLMKLFRKVKMEGVYWAVSLVNPKDPTKRKIASSTFDNERDASECAAEFNATLESAADVVETKGAPKVALLPGPGDRLIRFND